MVDGGAWKITSETRMNLSGNVQPWSLINSVYVKSHTIKMRHRWDRTLCDYMYHVLIHGLISLLFYQFIYVIGWKKDKSERTYYQSRAQHELISSHCLNYSSINSANRCDYLLSCQSIDPNANALILCERIRKRVDAIRNTKWIHQCSILVMDRVLVVVMAAGQIPPQQAHWKITSSCAVHPFGW